MDAADWDERYEGAIHHWGVEPNGFVREQCERLPVGLALDLGCGEGRNAVWLARLGWRVTGVDFSNVAIHRAREVTAQLSQMQQLRLAWVVDDVTTLEPKVASLDLVVASYVHLPPEQRDTMLARAAAALRPRGHLVIAAHDKRNLAEGVSGPEDLDVLYDADEMRALLADGCGLVIEVARTAERHVIGGVAFDTVVRARRD